MYELFTDIHAKKDILIYSVYNWLFNDSALTKIFTDASETHCHTM